MQRWRACQWIASVGFVLLFSAVSSQAGAQSPVASQAAAQTPADSVEEESPEAGVVEVDGRPLLTVYDFLGTHTPEDRAHTIEARITAAARNPSLSPDETKTLSRASYTWIVVGPETIMAVTDADALRAGKPRETLAAEYAANIRSALEMYRKEHGSKVIFRGLMKTVIATFLLLLALWAVRRIWLVLRDGLKNHIAASAQVANKPVRRLWIAYLAPIALAVGTLGQWVILLALVQVYLTIVLGFFATTRLLSLTATRWLLSQLALGAKAAIEYLPNLVVLAVIVLVTSYAIRLGKLTFSQIQQGDLKIRGFYSDWAEPTEKLVRALVLILALVVAFPYLPGAKSPAFQGISIFVGVLISLGSSSAVANAVAGIILTYMRSFLVGDWVQIGDTTGEVVEKTLLVTRILTPKAEIITIPNAAVMNTSAKNYSVEAKKAGVIFHTTVTIGYDAPWRTVHRLLTTAALSTQNISREPQPFVLQNRLDDFYVAYELNAYTGAPREMLNILSDLHQNIQDRFNEAGVEICSPHFSSLRDGNATAIPKQYVAPEYSAPGFRVVSPDRFGMNKTREKEERTQEPQR